MHLSWRAGAKLWPTAYPGPDLPIGYAGLSLGTQDPRGPPANCGTHRVNQARSQLGTPGRQRVF